MHHLTSISDPSNKLLEAIRWSYLAILCLIFTLGTVNFVIFLLRNGKWRTLPLLLLYISAQLTLMFGIARTAFPY